MSNIWFSSDLHLGHNNIRKYCNRPFTSVDEMDNIIIENFNKVIKPGDRLYLLGDLSFTGRDLKEYMSRINGNKYFIIGNHDPKQFDVSLFEWVGDVKMVSIKDRSIFLSHYAHRVWPQSHYGCFHLFGHSHNTLPGYRRSMDVGVDCNNFMPFNLDDIILKLKDQPYSFEDA